MDKVKEGYKDLVDSYKIHFGTTEYKLKRFPDKNLHDIPTEKYVRDSVKGLSVSLLDVMDAYPEAAALRKMMQPYFCLSTRVTVEGLDELLEKIAGFISKN